MPSACSSRSLIIAPMTPVQLWAGLPAGKAADGVQRRVCGAIGNECEEEEAGTTRSISPMSSFRRRLRVGVSTSVSGFIKAHGDGCHRTTTSAYGRHTSNPRATSIILRTRAANRKIPGWYPPV